MSKDLEDLQAVLAKVTLALTGGPVTTPQLLSSPTTDLLLALGCAAMLCTCFG